MIATSETPSFLYEVGGAIFSCLLGSIGWLLQTWFSLSKSHERLSSEFHDFKDAHANHPSRLTKVEEAIVSIQAQAEKSERQFAAIMDKLDAIPRLNALMEAYGSMVQMVVPRAEVEARVKSVEERLQRVEDDVRDGMKG